MRISLAAIAGLLWLSSSLADACTCLPNPPPKEALAAASAVFAGKVEKIEKHGEFQLAVTIRVDTTWKGVEGREVAVYTGSNGAICGVEFEKGKSYLVYARAVKNEDKGTTQLHASLCSRTCAMTAATEDLVALGDGKKVGQKDE